MSYRRSRIIRRRDVEEAERLGLLHARAIDRARGIMQRAETTARGAGVGPTLCAKAFAGRNSQTPE